MLDPLSWAAVRASPAPSSRARHPCLRPRFAALLLFGVCSVGSADAQVTRPAFDSLSIGLSLVAGVNRDTFDSFWRSQPGLELSAEAPFYLGVIETGVRYVGFSARDPGQPDFSSFFPFIGWGLEWKLTRRLRWYSGGRVGSFVMFFDSDQGNVFEQELAAALGGRLAFSFAKSWSVDISAHHDWVFTRRRLKFLFLAAGLRHVFPGPRWLKELLE